MGHDIGVETGVFSRSNNAVGGQQQNSALKKVMLGSARMHTVHGVMCSLSIG